MRACLNLRFREIAILSTGTFVCPEMKAESWGNSYCGRTRLSHDQFSPPEPSFYS